jgi:hypothetical protein
MSVAITAQAPVVTASQTTASPATASPQASQGTGATAEQGAADFAKARVDVGGGEVQIAQATKSVASSGEMIGKLREFIDKAHQSDMKNRATRAKQRAAAAEAKIELATLDTIGSLGKFNSLAAFTPVAQSGSFNQSGFGQYASLGLPPGPASASFAGGPGLEMKGRLTAAADKMTDELMDGAIHQMWTRVVMHGTNSVTKSVMSLLKGQ